MEEARRVAEPEAEQITPDQGPMYEDIYSLKRLKEYSKLSVTMHSAFTPNIIATL